MVSVKAQPLSALGGQVPLRRIANMTSTQRRAGQTRVALLALGSSPSYLVSDEGGRVTGHAL